MKPNVSSEVREQIAENVCGTGFAAVFSCFHTLHFLHQPLNQPNSTVKLQCIAVTNGSIVT